MFSVKDPRTSDSRTMIFSCKNKTDKHSTRMKINIYQPWMGTVFVMKTIPQCKEEKKVERGGFVACPSSEEIEMTQRA